MFGMDQKKDKKKGAAFEFDIEKELATREKQKEYVQRIQTKINTIKQLLRAGDKKENFEQLGVLLNAYLALSVVLGKVVKQAGTK